ncbi:MAG: choice-of-anchor D domain-containing protein, partial [Rhizobacter sp.]|nr:choice-of-anchor D domain-containing protein [Ferruginibacter sp.]
MKKIYLKILLGCLIGLLSNVHAQVNMTTTATNIQNFNTLQSTPGSPTWTNNVTISNWYSERTGTGTTYGVDAGGAAGGNLYSYGSSLATERALGTLGSSNASAGNFAHGILLRNTSGIIITDIKVSYTLEQWRNGGNTSPNLITFWYKKSSSTITALNPSVNGTWTQVSALSLSSPINTASAGPLDGNSVGNKVSLINIPIPSLSLANNEYIMLKWEDPDHTGTDHGLAIDDVTVGWTVNSSTNFYWNGSTTTGTGPSIGGTGNWNITAGNTNWISPTDNASGTSTLWTNSVNSIANFTAGAGTSLVDIGTDVVAANINISSGLNYAFTASTNRIITGKIAAVGNLSLRGISAGLTISDEISGAGTLGFASTGTGSVTLNGNSIHTGAKNLVSGTLNLGHVNALGTSGSLNITGGALDNTTGGTLTIPNYTQTWGGNFTYSGTTQNLNLGAGSVSIYSASTITVSNNTLTVGGLLSGGAALGKSGVGTLLLTGANNTHSGGTVISGGSLITGAVNTLGSGNLTLSGGTLRTGTSTGNSQTTGILGLTASSTIELGTGSHNINFSGKSGTWTAGQAITITGWTGTPGITGTEGKIFIGGTALSTAELNQINFAPGFGPGATQLPGGEIVPRIVYLDFLNLQSPATASVTIGANITAYAQVYKAGLTDAAGQAPGILAWIGYNTSNTDPSTWTNWVPATFNTQAGNNDEYQATFGAALTVGTYYYASRFLINGGIYQYGGYSAAGGGEWDDPDYVSGILTINDNTVDFCNLQAPYAGSILRGGGFDVYAQVYEPGVTNAGGQGAGVVAEIGYSTSNNDPSLSGWTWTSAIYNTDIGNNDEYRLNLGATLASVGSGVYYYASRFRLGSGSYRYGGIVPGGSGGNFWDNVNYISGLLHVAEVRGNGNLVTYGGTSPALTNFTDFGSTCGSNPVARTFSIANSSTTHQLNFGTVTVTGTNAADFLVTTAPTLPVAISGSANFIITFTPSSAGVRNATINVTTDANSYSFAIAGTGQTLTTVTTQPTNQSAPSLGSATFTAAGAGHGTVTYQWQLFDGVSTWNNIINGSPYSNATTAMLTINPLSFSMNGNQYRCIITAACGSVITNVVTLTVTPGPVWTNDINGTNPGQTTPYTTGQVFDPNITVSGIVRSTGVNGNTGNDRYNTNNWNTSLDLAKYLEFSLNPTSGYEINFTNFVYTGQVSSGSPLIAIRSSLDNFSSNIGTPIFSGSTVLLTGAEYQNVGCPISFRFYVFNIGSGAAFSINNFTFNGTITSPVSSKITINNGGTPPTGNINLGVNDVTLSAFNILPNASQTLSTVNITTTGSATSSDINNLRLFWDQNSNGIVDGGDAVVSGVGVPLAPSINFTLAAQTFGCPGRHYLLVGDVLTTAIPGRTVTASIANSADVTSTMSNKTGNALGNQQTIAFLSLVTDYYRSNVTSGNWNTAASWLSSRDNSNFFPATAAPTSTAGTITIMSTHTITINSAISLDETSVNGVLDLQTGSVLTINDAMGADLNISAGGVMNVRNGVTNTYAGIINQLANASINVATAGKISIIGNGTNVAANVDQFAWETRNVWNHQSVFEWNCATNTIGIANNNFFPNVNATTIPYLIISANSGNPGGSNPTTVNGHLLVNTNVTLSGSGNKTFRDGISGSGALSIPSSVGTVSINGAAPLLGGSSLVVNTDKNLNIPNGITVPVDSIITVNEVTLGAPYPEFTKGNGPVFLVNGTIDMTVATISNGTGLSQGTVTVNGTLKTKSTGGLRGTGATISDGVVNVNTGSTIEYNATAAQSITGSGAIQGTSPYYNLIFSGSGTKTSSGLASVNSAGSVRITGSTTVDFTSHNLGLTSPNATSFTMDGGKLILGTAELLPLMDGTYALSGGVIEYVTGGGAKRIRNKTYRNIEVSGVNVSSGGGNITINSTGTFTVKNGGIFTMNDNSIVGIANETQSLTVENNGVFRVSIPEGFNGPGAFPNSPAVRTGTGIPEAIDNIILQSGSTVDYARQTGTLPVTAANGSQSITIPVSAGSPIAYQNLVLSGDGTKTPIYAGAIIEVKGNLTKNGATTFAHNEGTFSFAGNTLQTYTVNATGPVMEFNNIENNNPAGLDLRSDMAIAQALKLEPLSQIALRDTSDIIIKSKLDTTARVDIIPVNAIITYENNTNSGRFVIERYIAYTGNWNLLGSPTTEAQSLRASWQENGVNNAGYGAQITMPLPIGPGLDNSSPNFSFKWWDNTANSNTGAFVGVNNTTAEMVNRKQGFYGFIRGDRNVGPGQLGGPTTLRSRGKIYTPATPAPSTTATASSA